VMWKDAYLESRVRGADPLELIRLLYQHGLDSIRTARAKLAAGDIAARSRAISQAIGALSQLSGALNLSAGGSIGRNLEQLYHYMSQRLFEANLKRQDGPLAEVESLLVSLAEAWMAIGNTPAGEKPQSPVPMPEPGAWQEAVSSSAHGWSA